jgi:RNA polymerase sigma-70 factor (ECF subfamily)
MYRKQTPPPDNQEAFTALFERYKNLVYKTAFLMMSDAYEAEEALQEVFVLVYRSLDSYDPQKGALTTWLYRIAVNSCLGRQRKCQLEWVPADEEELAEISTGHEAGPGSLAEREAMLQAIHRLGEKLQVVVILCFYWDLPYAEIAQILDIPLGTVKSRLDLALRSLRKILNKTEATRTALSSGLSVEEEARP